jgi:hypothetical protein
MMSVQDLMEGILLVKGAAMEASPILTMGSSPSSRSSSDAAMCAAELATPLFLAMSALILLASAISSAMNSFMACAGEKGEES